MSTRLPRGFRAKKDATAGNSKENRAPSDATLNASTKSDTANVDVALKRDRVENISSSNPAPKKHKKDEDNSSYAESQLKLIAPFIKEKELKAWQSQKPEEKNEALIQSSVQFLLSSIGRAQEAQKDKLQISKLEAERRLEETIVTNDNKWKKTVDTVKADYASVSADLQESFEHRDLLKKQKDELEARLNASEKEKEALKASQQENEDRIFKEGFDCYLLGFLANDPSYNWEDRFGKDTAEDINAFKVENAEKIKEKRIELGLEEPSKDVPSNVDAPPESQQVPIVVNPKAILNSEIPSTSTTVLPKGASKENDAA